MDAREGWNYKCDKVVSHVILHLSNANESNSPLMHVIVIVFMSNAHEYDISFNVFISFFVNIIEKCIVLVMCKWSIEY